MVLKPCLDCGKPTEGTRCPDDQRRRERTRGRASASRRGYDRRHRAERSRWAPKVSLGQVDCARCKERIEPGAAWDLGHTDDRRAWTGPEHQDCNRSAGGTAGARATNAIKAMRDVQ